MLHAMADGLMSDASPAASALRWLLDLTLQGTLLLLLGGGIALLIGRASAALRHLVWLLTLGGLLGLPMLSIMMPRQLALLHPVSVQSADSVSPSVKASRSTLPHAGALEDQQTAPINTNTSPQRALPQTSDRPSQSLSLWRRGVWPLFPFGLWLSGMLLVASRVVVALQGIRRLRCQSFPLLDGRLVEQAHEAQQALRDKRPVTLRVAFPDADVIVPLTWGWLRPVVLLPADAEAWPALRQRAVLLHELAHVARGDWITLLVSQAACTLFWFHPLVWRAAHSLRVESERATDDRVLAAGVGAAEYGQCLLEFVRLLTATQRRPNMKLTIAMARPSTLENRLLALLDGRRNRRGVTRLHLLGGSAATAVVLLSVATLGAVGDASERDSKFAAKAMTNTPDLSSPEATVRSFITAMENYDVAQIVACLHVEKPLTAWWVSAMQRHLEITNRKEAFPFEKLQTRITGDRAAVNIVSKGHMTVMSLDGKVRGHGWKMAGRVDLRQFKNGWKIVPLASSDSIPKTYSIVAGMATNMAIGITAPDPLSPSLRSDGAAAACYENMGQLSSAMEWPGTGDRRLRLKGWQGRFLNQLKETVRTEAVDPQHFFHCPADKSGAISYSINERFEGFDMRKSTKATSKTVFLYEGKNGQLNFRHHGYAMVRFYTSEVRFVSREEAKSLRWTP